MLKEIIREILILRGHEAKKNGKEIQKGKQTVFKVIDQKIIIEKKEIDIGSGYERTIA